MGIDGGPGVESDLPRVSTRAAACGTGTSAGNASNTLAPMKSRVLLTFVKIGLDRVVEIWSQQARRGLFSGFVRCIFGAE